MPCMKYGYESKSQASIALSKVKGKRRHGRTGRRDRPGTECRAYPCEQPDCELWHLTSSPGRTPKQIVRKKKQDANLT